MAVSDAQRRANAKYRREKTKQVVTTFYPADGDIYDYLCKQPNKSGYIKQLIRRDMNRGGSA